MSNYGYDYKNDQKLQSDGALAVKRAFVAHLEYADPAAAATDAVLSAVTDDGTEQTIDTGITDPDYARTITATAGGTAGDIGAVQVTVTGTNLNDEVITEVLPAFTVDTAGTVTGSKAFKTVTEVVIPAHDGTGATTEIGVSDELGVPYVLDKDTILSAYINGVKESTLPTLTTGATVELNTLDLDTALDGNAVDVYLLVN